MEQEQRKNVNIVVLTTPYRVLFSSGSYNERADGLGFEVFFFLLVVHQICHSWDEPRCVFKCKMASCGNVSAESQ